MVSLFFFILNKGFYARKVEKVKIKKKLGDNFDLPANQSGPTFVDIYAWLAVLVGKQITHVDSHAHIFNHLISRIKHDEFFPLEKITFICMSYHKTLSLKEKEKHVYWKNTLSYKEKTHPLW